MKKYLFPKAFISNDFSEELSQKEIKLNFLKQFFVNLLLENKVRITKNVQIALDANIFNLNILPKQGLVSTADLFFTVWPMDTLIVVDLSNLNTSTFQYLSLRNKDFLITTRLSLLNNSNLNYAFRKMFGKDFLELLENGKYIPFFSGNVSALLKNSNLQKINNVFNYVDKEEKKLKIQSFLNKDINGLKFKEIIYKYSQQNSPCGKAMTKVFNNLLLNIF